MTPTSPIHICPVGALRHLPDSERDVIRRFLADHIRGMSAQDDKRWRRLWGRIMNAEPGEGFLIDVHEERSGPFHRRHRAVLQRVFEAQDGFRTLDGFDTWSRIGAGFVTYEGQDGKLVAVPRSTAFPACSENDIRELHPAMVDFWYTPRALRRMFRAVKPLDRADMLDAALADPMEHAA